MRQPRRAIKTVAWIAGGVAILATPIVVYVAEFGTGLSSEHSRWAEFGSAMSGIYSPVLAVFALLVLVMQVAIQRSTAIHQYDQAYIQRAVADLEFYLARLDLYLKEMPRAGFTVRDLLHERMQPAAAADLDSSAMRAAAKDLDAAAPGVLAVWYAVYPILDGMQAGGTSSYQLARTSTIQKIIVVLGFETCAALDNFHRARTEGRLSVAYEFTRFARSGAEL